MKKLTIAAAVATAMTMPVALGQTTANPETAPTAASPHPNAAAPDAMYGQSQSLGQSQGTYGPGMMGGNKQGQGPGPGQGEGPGQGTYGSGMMGGNGQGQGPGPGQGEGPRQGTYGSGMMRR